MAEERRREPNRPDGDVHDDAELEPSLPAPPDGGWGWMVVLGSFLIHIVADGVAYSFGIFITEFIDYFDAGRSAVGWVGSLMVGMTLSSGPIASVLTNKYGCRVVTIIGAVIATVAFVLGMFSPNLVYMYITLGALAGLGFGFIYLPAIVSVTCYFEKNRAFATGLAVCGSGVGTFIFAPMASKLVENFGWRGALLIEAGLILNCMVFGGLFRPLLAPRAPARRVANEEDAQEKHNEEHPNLPAIQVDPSFQRLLKDKTTTSTLSLPHDVMQATDNGNSPLSDVKRHTSDLMLHKAHLRNTEHKHSHRTLHVRAMDRKDVFYQGSLYNIPLYRSNPSMYAKSVTSLNKIGEVTLEKKSYCSELSNEMHKMLDITLLKDPIFLIFAISNFLTSIGFNVPYIYLPDHAKQLGISAGDASFLIAVVGIANMCGRVIFGWLSDRSFVNRLMLYNTALTICGLSTVMVSWCTTYPLLVAYSASFGLMTGVYVSLTSVVLVDLLGLERLTSSFGLLLLFQGVAVIIGPPIAGWMYDLTGSYDASFWITGAVIGMSGLMLYSIPLIRRLEKRKSFASNTHLSHQLPVEADHRV